MFNPKGENTMKLEKLTITQLKDYCDKLPPCTYSLEFLVNIDGINFEHEAVILKTKTGSNLEFKGVRFAVIREESSLGVWIAIVCNDLINSIGDRVHNVFAVYN